ncbi:MAG: hypothetical protein M3P95_03525 [Actinomycetota bacterium]|nr:hypothetical protein [Actinomycetota bacterium]
MLAHPAGPLHVIAVRLEWEPAYTDDRIAQAARSSTWPPTPATEGPLPVVLSGGVSCDVTWTSIT